MLKKLAGFLRRLCAGLFTGTPFLRIFGAGFAASGVAVSRRRIYDAACGRSAPLVRQATHGLGASSPECVAVATEKGFAVDLKEVAVLPPVSKPTRDKPHTPEPSLDSQSLDSQHSYDQPAQPYQPDQPSDPLQLCTPSAIALQPILPPPAPPAEALWIDKFLVKKQLASTRETATLPLQNLLKLLPGHYQQLKDLTASVVVPSGLIAALWRTLQANTRKHESTWQFVQTDGRFVYSDSNDTPLSTNANANANVKTITEPPVPEVVLSRYRDVALVKASALIDSVRSKAEGDTRFLHANRVDLGCGRRFLAGQKPVCGEIPGFQRMLIEQDVGLIVDLTRDREEQQIGDYVPEQKGSSNHPESLQIVVSCNESKRLKDLTIHAQSFTIRCGDAIKQIRRLHFTQWPDHGVISPDALIALADRIDALSAERNRAIFVHCMAGMGRTGTLMSFLAARSRIAHELIARKMPLNTETVLRITIEVVARGRIDRGPHFVQTEGQFGLLVRTLLKDFLQKQSHGH